MLARRSNRIMLGFILVSIAYNLYITFHLLRKDSSCANTRITPSSLTSQQGGNAVQTILHIAREHSALASFGGIGSVVGSLSHFQAKVPNKRVGIIMPFYSLISQQLNVKQISQVQIRYKQFYKMHISIFEGDLPYGVHVFLVDKPHDITSISSDQSNEFQQQEKLKTDQKLELFKRLFDASTMQEIYNVPEGLRLAERDALFCLAVSQFLQEQLLGISSVSSSPSSSPATSQTNWFSQQPNILNHLILHIHGATNALVQPLLNSKMGKSRPTSIYTLHDYIYEPNYGMEKDILKDFDFQITTEIIQQFPTSVDVVFPSQIGINYADAVTCVSKNMKLALQQNEIKFAFRRELEEKIAKNVFFGISNAVTPSTSAFTDPLLKSHGCNFSSSKNIFACKSCARSVLAQLDIFKKLFLNEQKEKFPILLFIGRFEPTKGLLFLPMVSKLARTNNFFFIVMGHHVTDTSTEAQQWKSLVDSLKSQENTLVLDSLDFQKSYGSLVRAAADFTLVPSTEEAFGLIAAEAQKFASIPIASNVGGLRDIITDYSVVKQAKLMGGEVREKRVGETSAIKSSTVSTGISTGGSSNYLQKANWSGFLFENKGIKHKQQVQESMKKAILLALSVYEGIDKTSGEHDKFLNSIILNIPYWDNFENGPIIHYNDAYTAGQAQRIQLIETDGVEVKECTNCLQALVKTNGFGPNLIKNSGFNGPFTKIKQYWKSSLEPTSNDKEEPNTISTINNLPAITFEFSSLGRSGNCIVMSNKNLRQTKSAQQIVKINQKQPRDLYVSGWSKAEQVSIPATELFQSNQYSITVMLVDEKQKKHGPYYAVFNPRIQHWQQATMIIKKQEFAVKEAVVSCMFSQHIGAAYFDDLSLSEVY